MSNEPQPLSKLIQIAAGTGCPHKNTCNVETIDLHICPFQEDVNNNLKPFCQCCKECEEDCAMDI